MNFNRKWLVDIVPHRFTDLVSTQGSQLRNHMKLLEFRGTLLGDAGLDHADLATQAIASVLQGTCKVEKANLRKTPQPIFRILVG